MFFLQKDISKDKQKLVGFEGGGGGGGVHGRLSQPMAYNVIILDQVDR